MYELRAIGDKVSIRFYVLRFSGLGLVVTRLIIEVSQQEFCILSGIATLGFKNLGVLVFIGLPIGSIVVAFGDYLIGCQI